MHCVRTPRVVEVLALCLTLAACGGGGGGGSSSPPPTTPPPTQNPPPPSTPQLPDPATAPALKDEFAGFFRIGAAIEPEQLDNATDRALLLKHYNSLTAENAMKPDTIAPQDLSTNLANFDRAERIVDFATANNMEVHGHTLVWHRTAPDWFFAGDPSDPSYRAAVAQRLTQYITTVVDQFEGRVSSWDVVNEVASDAAGQTYRTDSPWYQAFSANGGDGREYIRVAFQAARAADPQALLFINDYSTENPEKLAKVLEIIEYVEATGEVTVDGVGHQFHLQRSSQASHVDTALTTVANRGKVNRVTELDISVYADPGECFSVQTIPPCQADYGATFSNIPQSVVSEHARLYRELFAVFEDHDATLGTVTTWGISDAHTWLNFYPANRTNRPLLFDTSGNPKLAFWAVVDPAFTIP